MKMVTIGSLEITRVQAESEIARAKRRGARPPQVYVVALERFRSHDQREAQKRPAVWNF